MTSLEVDVLEKRLKQTFNHLKSQFYEMDIIWR